MKRSRDKPEINLEQTKPDHQPIIFKKANEKEKSIMKLKKITEKAAALSMATAMLASVCAPTYTAVLSAVPVSAASSKDTTNNTATTKDLANADIIDTSKTGSITVHKYDITSAEAAGDYTEGQYKATGESDNRVENALADYAIQGVQFTYLRVGNIEQYSKTDGTGRGYC